MTIHVNRWKKKQNMDAVLCDLPDNFPGKTNCLFDYFIIYFKIHAKISRQQIHSTIKLKISNEIVEFCECWNESKGNAYTIFSIQLNIKDAINFSFFFFFQIVCMPIIWFGDIPYFVWLNSLLLNHFIWKYCWSLIFFFFLFCFDGYK